MDGISKERFFSVELKSKVNLEECYYNQWGSRKRFGRRHNWKSTAGGVYGDGLVLEVIGDKGVLRINLTIDDIKTKPNQSKEA